MDFQKLIASRYSVRAYRPDPVPEPLLRQVLEAARPLEELVHHERW